MKGLWSSGDSFSTLLLLPPPLLQLPLMVRGCMPFTMFPGCSFTYFALSFLCCWRGEGKNHPMSQDKKQARSSVFTDLYCLLEINANILLLLCLCSFLWSVSYHEFFDIGLWFFGTPQNTIASVCLWCNQKDISCKFSIWRILRYWPLGSWLKQSRVSPKTHYLT